MNTSFTDWGSVAYLEHYGIPGMKWGVRRYLNRDGTLTALGAERYGAKGRGARAQRMAKDFNDLDAGYAKAEGRRRQNADMARQYARKMNKALAKGNTGKAEQMSAKARKFGEKAAEANHQKQGIESLQWKIIGKAASKGYTLKSEEVRRSIEVGRKSVVVSGQNVTISKHGDGSHSVINYRGVQAATQRQRDDELAKYYRGSNR